MAKLTEDERKELTRAQMRLLEEVASGDTYSVVGYGPAIAAVNGGLLEWACRHAEAGHLRLTPAGRAALSPPGDGWLPISTAPKDRHLLLCGRQIPDNSGVRFGCVIVTSGYWDGIDSSWCMTGSTWQGPFIEPTHWMPLPEPFTPITGDHHER